MNSGRIYRESIDKAFEIQKKTGINSQTLSVFFNVCPYTIEELRGPSRKRNLTDWRQVFNTVAFVHFKNLVEASYYCNRDHTSIIHSRKCVLSGIPELQKIIDSVVNNNPTVMFCNQNKLINFTPQYV